MRLDTEYNHIGTFNKGCIGLDGADFILACQIIKPFGPDVGGKYVLRLINLCGDYALDDGFSHIAAADETYCIHFFLLVTLIFKAIILD